MWFSVINSSISSSHSWSANVCGYKRWWMLHPSLTPLLYDSLGHTLAPDFFADLRDESDGNDDDARMAEDATPAATAGGCVAAFSEDFGFVAASVAK